MNIDAGFALPLALPSTVGGPAVTDIPVADFSMLLAAATPVAVQPMSVTPQCDPTIIVSEETLATSSGSLTGTTEPFATPPHQVACDPQAAAGIVPPIHAVPTATTVPLPIQLPPHSDPVATPDAVQEAPDAVAAAPPPVDSPSLVALQRMPRRPPVGAPVPIGALQRPAGLRQAPEVDTQAPAPTPVTPLPIVVIPPAIALPDFIRPEGGPLPADASVADESDLGPALAAAPALRGNDIRVAPSRAPGPAMVVVPIALPISVPVGPPVPVALPTVAGDAVVLSPPETPHAVGSATIAAPRPDAPVTTSTAPAMPVAVAAPAVTPQPPAVPAVIGAERRNRSMIGDDVEAPAPVAASLGDMMPRLQLPRESAPPPPTLRETAAPAPIIPELNAEAAIATDRFGEVRIAVEGTATDVKVSMALTPTAVLAAGEAQRLANGLAADLAATGVRLQSLDISGGDTARGGTPQGQREPAPPRPQPTAFASQRAPNPPRSDRYA